MVASYSPTSARSDYRYSFTAQFKKGLRDTWVSLCSAHIPSARLNSAFITNSFVLSSTAIEQLAALPSDTFGHQWLTLLQSEDAECGSTTHFIDSLHILTGYGTEAMGKAELQAFLLGATGDIMSLFQCIGHLHALSHQSPARPASLPNGNIVSQLYRAYQRGRISYFDLDNWHPEQLWDLPLQYVRQWFGIR